MPEKVRASPKEFMQKELITEELIVEEFEAIKADLTKLNQMLKRLILIHENQITRINYLKSKNGL